MEPCAVSHAMVDGAVTLRSVGVEKTPLGVELLVRLMEHVGKIIDREVHLVFLSKQQRAPVSLHRGVRPGREVEAPAVKRFPFGDYVDHRAPPGVAEPHVGKCDHLHLVDLRGREGCEHVTWIGLRYLIGFPVKTYVISGGAVHTYLAQWGDIDIRNIFQGLQQVLRLRALVMRHVVDEPGVRHSGQ